MTKYYAERGKWLLKSLVIRLLRRGYPVIGGSGKGDQGVGRSGTKVENLRSQIVMSRWRDKYDKLAANRKD